MGLSPVPTAQSGPPAQPILPMLMPSTGQMVQTTPVMQMGLTLQTNQTTQATPTTQATTTTQMASMAQVTSLAHSTSTTQSIPMIQPTPLTQLVSTAQTSSTTQITPMVQVIPLAQLASAVALGSGVFNDPTSSMLQAAEEVIESYGKAERRKKKNMVRENVKLHQRVVQLMHQKLVQKAAHDMKMQEIQSKLKRGVCLLNELS